MRILKRLAKYILRTDIVTICAQLKDTQLAYQRELKINEDLKEHFVKKSVPIDFYKTLEENQVSTGDLMMLKNAYIRLKSWQDLNIKRHEKEFLPNYNHSIKAGFIFHILI